MTVPALSSVPVCELDFTDQLAADASAAPSTTLTCACATGAGRTGDRREIVLVYELWQDDERLGMGVVPLVPDKHLKLTDPQLRCTVREADENLVIEVTAQRLARFVELALEGVDVVFSDNYFDVPAGRTVAVTCPLPQGWTVEQARAALQVRSLHDSFAVKA